MSEVSSSLVDLYVSVVVALNEAKNSLDGEGHHETNPSVIRYYMPKYRSDKYLLQEIERIDSEIEGVKERTRSELTDAEKEKASKLFNKYGLV